MDVVIVDRAQKTTVKTVEHDILANGEARNEIALLMNDSHAGGDRVARPSKRTGAPLSVAPLIGR